MRNAAISFSAVLAVLLLVMQVSAIPPPCPEQECRAAGEQRCAAKRRPSQCWTLGGRGRRPVCSCCHDCAPRPGSCANVRCAACPNGSTLSLQPGECCRCVRSCDNVRCAACPNGSTLSLQPGECCRCVPNVDCRLVFCASCPRGTTLSPTPTNCCRCV